MPDFNDDPNANEPADRKRQAVRFINDNRIGALATADGAGKPDSAIVYCTVRDDLRMYFITRVEGRKFANVTARPDIALAFYNEPGLQTLRLCGHARRVDDMKLEQEVIGELFRLGHHTPSGHLPTIHLFEQGATHEIAVIEVTPYEMTFADFTQPRKGTHRPVFTKII